MAAGDLPQTADPLGAALGQALFGGATTTTNPGNIAPLQQVLAWLQAQDFNALLQSIFQQAAGQIPGLQAAYGNAMGARSGGNSAVQAALNELLKQTTLAGQQQIASQQAQNFQTQGQVAANIAQATRGTQTTQGADLGGIAQNLLLLQGLSMLTGKSGPLSGLGDKIGDVGKAVGGMFTSPTSDQTVAGNIEQCFRAAIFGWFGRAHVINLAAALLVSCSRSQCLTNLPACHKLILVLRSPKTTITTLSTCRSMISATLEMISMVTSWTWTSPPLLGNNLGDDYGRQRFEPWGRPA